MRWSPMISPLTAVDDILRHPRLRQREFNLPWPVVIGTVITNGLLYGAIMGSHAWLVGNRSFTDQFLQIGYSAIKVPLLLVVTTLVALPSFLVFNTILGLRRDFEFVLRAILSVQAGLAIILASLAPLTFFFYLSSTANQAAYQAAILFNGLMFGIASISAQLILRMYYRPLIRSNRRHRLMLWVWIGLYSFVGIQLGWILRPFVGNHRQEISFFRQDKVSNAYVKVWDLILELIEPML